MTANKDVQFFTFKMTQFYGRPKIIFWLTNNFNPKHLQM